MTRAPLPYPRREVDMTSVLAACCVFVLYSGYLEYEKIVRQLLDGDYYAMYSPAGVDNTQVGRMVCPARLE